jgi:hypothetical protein
MRSTIALAKLPGTCISRKMIMDKFAETYMLCNKHLRGSQQVQKSPAVALGASDKGGADAQGQVDCVSRTSSCSPVGVGLGSID